MKRKGLIICLAAGHGLNDLIAGYFMGSLLHLKTDLTQIGLGLILYNLLAFGGQYPVALWIERYANPKRFLLFSYLLNTTAVSLFQVAPQIAIMLAGIASAIYHVAGGSVCATENKALNIGLFAAPGVLGLIAGGWLAYFQYDILIGLLIVAILFLGLLFKLSIPSKKIIFDNEAGHENKFVLDRHDLIMILLLTLISLRSAIWNIFQLAHEGNYEWLLWIAAAAFTGKIIGGWLADKIGWRLYIFLSLIVATPLISFFRDEIILFCIGIGLLQSGIPATTSLLIQSVKGKTERAIGLSFGLAIVIGGIVLYGPVSQVVLSNMVLFGLAALLVTLLFFAKTKSISLYK